MSANFRNTQIKRDKETGKNYYVNTAYPTIPSDSEDAYISTKNGDRLDLLAEEFYGDSSLYWVIATANPETTRNDSFFVTPGIQLRIPVDLNSVAIDYNKINKRR